MSELLADVRFGDFVNPQKYACEGKKKRLNLRICNHRGCKPGKMIDRTKRTAYRIGWCTNQLHRSGKAWGARNLKRLARGDCAALPLPTPEAIWTQLGSILASPEFQLPERGRAFLRYIVEESLAGRAKRIKAYSIAVEVFGRDEGITPDDPEVRIEAGRLRRALERYYLVAGQSDPIRIDIPKGSLARLSTSSRYSLQR